MTLNPHYKALGFYDIIEQLKNYAVSEQAKQVFEQMEPCLDEMICRRKMRETTAARQMLDACGAPPLAAMGGLEKLLQLSKTGAMLTTEQLVGVSRFASASSRMISYLKRGAEQNESISAYGMGLDPLVKLREEIERCVREDGVLDEASPALRQIRRKKEALESQIRERLTKLLQSRGKQLADSYIATRNGHYVLPVKRQFQNQFPGTVIETSQRGTTVFMEPDSVGKIQAELTGLNYQEEDEICRILYSLSSAVSDYTDAIRGNMEIMEVLDVLFAKAKLSADQKAGEVKIGGEKRIDIRKGRHPLLPEERCVPLDLKIDERISGIIITGPNTGGKTVTLKTVGLFTMMAQCGLHIPCGEGSYLAMRDAFLCDIGDSQNISQNLSTFSGHMNNVIGILKKASPDSLVLLDELGSGTDPAEGMGIAVAVLDELKERGCMFLVTTHYSKVKTYAEQTEGITSARMAFDPESLAPLYRLEIGKSGESCALLIAKRLGLPEHLLEKARCEVYGTEEGNKHFAETKMAAPKSRLKRLPPPSGQIDISGKFQMGDSVMVLPEGETGIVYRPADEKGDVIVQIKGKKRLVKHNRLKLQVSADQLYPPDYDFSIIFDTVQNRKAKHVMGKRYDPSAVAVYQDEIE
ncbi:endonuclease MutS2 [Anaerolentibacter hominis]|uniref:endonuclease MutS2 n=1 Tax=Anaerolentibacter hominis TaxID=3079009 RepID=UPI0031B81AB1